MEVSTNFSQTAFMFRREIWISDFVINCILAFISLYLLVALLYQTIITKKRDKTNFFRLTLEEKYGVLSNYTCIAIAVVSFIRHLCCIGLFLVEWYAISSKQSMLQNHAAEIVCRVLSRITTISFGTGGSMIYLFLWFRQSVFYVHSSLQVLNNKFVQIFSFVIFILYVLFCIALLTAYLFTIRYELNEEGLCLFEIGKAIVYAAMIICWTSVAILMQIALLGLFIYPMLKQALWRQNQQEEPSSRLMTRVKKAVYLAITCFVTDIFSGVSLFFLYEKNSNNPMFLYSFNLLINHLVTIVCFDHWKKLLWPWITTCCKHISCFSDIGNDSSTGSVSLTRKQSVIMNNYKMEIFRSRTKLASE